MTRTHRFEMKLSDKEKAALDFLVEDQDIPAAFVIRHLIVQAAAKRRAELAREGR